MNRSRFVTLLAALALAAGIPHAFAREGLRVERVVPRQAAEALAQRGLHASPMTPAEEASLAARQQRWQDARHVLAPPEVNWSRFAARRKGWRPDARWFSARDGATPIGNAALGPGLPPPDTIRVAMLRIDFLTDRDGAMSTGNGRFDLSGPDTTQPSIDRPPRDRTFYASHLEALQRYYDAQSYGRVIVEGTVWPSEEDSAYHVSDMADFGPWSFSPDIFERAVHMFRTFLFAADSQSTRKGDRIPWDTYDRFILLHAGSDLQSDIRQDSPRDIPSFTIGVTDTDVVIFPDSIHRAIDRAALIPETSTQDNFYGAINGVLTHECGHLLFGLSDLYDINTGRPVVGYWSLMDSGNLTGARVGLPNGDEIFAIGLLPPSIDPWQRQFVSDVFVPTEMDYPDTVTLGNSQRNPDVKRVSLSSDEYLLLENRYIAPVPFVELDQDSVTRVILGPKSPDRFEYDALLPARKLPDDTPLPSGGLLVWHVDESVIPLEFAFPIDTSLRVNPDFGINTNPFRLGVSVIEADGLQDLGDPSSPFILGATLDPFFAGNNATLSDTTRPSLIPHIGTRPHKRIDALDPPGLDLRVSARRAWELQGWPVRADVPDEGAQLIAIDADGDRALDVCWAGGGSASPDSNALFAVRPSGAPLGGTYAFARLDRRPRPHMAAIATDVAGPGTPRGPSLFAVSTYADGPDTSTAGGRVWVLDHLGQVRPGWPAALPSIVTTPPVIAGFFGTARLYVGCADGRVYALDLDGAVLGVSNPPLAGGIAGRLAVGRDGVITIGPSGAEVFAAAGANGDVALFHTASMQAVQGWPVATGVPGFAPDLMLMHLNGPPPAVPLPGPAPSAGTPQLFVHHADWLWGFEPSGASIPGWGRDFGDTLVASLGAGDPDGDGLPELLTQTVTSSAGFVNRGGRYSPGWPRRATQEPFRTGSPALAVDVDGDGVAEVLAMNASGIVAALRADGRQPEGWPLASGLGTMGAPVAADLDLNGTLELIAPDRFGLLHGYTLPASGAARPPDVLARASSWPMVGGDPGRSAYLPPERTTFAPAFAAGPVVRGSFKAYPNPARRSPVTFAFKLSEPATVDFRIFDTSGHIVASFKRDAGLSDNAFDWDPGSVPAGLYVAKLRFRAASGTHDESIPVGVLR